MPSSKERIIRQGLNALHMAKPEMGEVKSLAITWAAMDAKRTARDWLAMLKTQQPSQYQIGKVCFYLYGKNQKQVDYVWYCLTTALENITPDSTTDIPTAFERQYGEGTKQPCPSCGKRERDARWKTRAEKYCSECFNKTLEE